jgi:hypothetical protein
MTKFTPGPWEWLYHETHHDGVGRVVTAQVVDVPTNQCVVEFSNTSHSEIVYEDDGDGGGSFHDEQARANARLISAAPSMYEALKTCLAFLEGDEIADGRVLAVDMAYAALSKAEGGT